MRWHYSRSMPVGRTVKVGVWWGGVFKGSVVFARACRTQHVAFGLKVEEVCELVRVALDKHEGFHVTEVVARAIRMLKQRCPGLRLIVSFADPAEGHVGRIYQAGNWIYTGESAAARMLVQGKRKLHRRAYTGVNFSVNPRVKVPLGASWVTVPGKHRYFMPLDKRMRRQLESLRLPYPAVAAKAGLAPSEPGGATPTRPLSPGAT